MAARVHTVGMSEGQPCWRRHWAPGRCGPCGPWDKAGGWACPGQQMETQVLGPRACGECSAFSAHGSPGLTWLPRNPQCQGQLLHRTSYLEQSQECGSKIHFFEGSGESLPLVCSSLCVQKPLASQRNGCLHPSFGGELANKADTDRQ